MKPTRDDDAVVDLLDVVLEDGVVVNADVIVTVADVPLIGINLRAAVAGMTTMTEHGIFTEHRLEHSASRDQEAARRGDARRVAEARESK